MAKTKATRDEMLARLRDIRLLTLDVDGVLTDGSLYYADDGSQLRKFNVKDGMGIKRAMKAGVEIAIITASKTPSISQRGRDLGIRRVVLAAEDKLAVVTDIAEDLGIDLDAIAHVGDDLNDLPVLTVVGCPMTVADAVDEVLDVAVFVTDRKGGDGAVREICDMIVEARRDGS